ncbi:MAG: hypothetical protein SFV54_18150 [Bryobacteraceae bacterium]|nr:hypothetical protein [Bryobacteraceae bacterium]
MSCTDFTDERLAQLHAFEHPRYFFGQLLGVSHFESEQEYFKSKLWLLNRLIHGYGVVCGLDVRVYEAKKTQVYVTPGLALDKWGREVVVASNSKPVDIPPAEAKPPQDAPNKEQRRDIVRQEGECREEDWVHVVLCFHSCNAEPEPVLASSCDSPERCAHGKVRESYTVSVRPGFAPHLDWDPELRNPFKAKPFNYGELVEWVTHHCQPCLGTTDDPCIPLANVRRPPAGEGVSEINIKVRPIVYSLDLLFELMLSTSVEPPAARGGRPYPGQAS